MKRKIRYYFTTKSEATKFATDMRKNGTVVKEVGEKNGKYYVVIED